AGSPNVAVHHDQFYARELGPHSQQDLKAARIWEVRVQNQDVRLSRANKCEHVRAVAGEADYLDIGLLLEPAAGSLAEHRRLVDDDNPGGAVFLDHGMHSLH